MSTTLGPGTPTRHISAIFRDFSASVGPRFNEQQGFRFLQAASVTARLSRFVDAKVSQCLGRHRWPGDGRPGEGSTSTSTAGRSLTEYIYRYGQDSEFRFSVNLLGVGQASTRREAVCA